MKKSMTYDRGLEMAEHKKLTEETGGNGFGYDSLFVKAGYTKTFAEIDEATKLKISHRGKALSKITLLLERLNK